MVAAALVVSALSLLIPWAIAFDAWSWIIWGREVTRLGLDTAGGPSWKPLSVVFTSVFALFGEHRAAAVAGRGQGGRAARARRRRRARAPARRPGGGGDRPGADALQRLVALPHVPRELRGDAGRGVRLGDRRAPRRPPPGRAGARRGGRAHPPGGVAVRRPLRPLGVAPRRDVVLGRRRLAGAAPRPLVRARPDRLGRRAGRLGRRARLRGARERRQRGRPRSWRSGATRAGCSPCPC